MKIEELVNHDYIGTIHLTPWYAGLVGIYASDSESIHVFLDRRIEPNSIKSTTIIPHVQPVCNIYNCTHVFLNRQ